MMSVLCPESLLVYIGGNYIKNQTMSSMLKSIGSGIVPQLLSSFRPFTPHSLSTAGRGSRPRSASSADAGCPAPPFDSLRNAVRCCTRTKIKSPANWRDFLFLCGCGESNPGPLLGRQLFYH